MEKHDAQQFVAPDAQAASFAPLLLRRRIPSATPTDLRLAGR